MEMTDRIVDPGLFEIYHFTRHPQHNAAWDAVTAPDGRSYIGLSNEGQHGLGAVLYEFDPYEKDPAQRLRHIIDVDKLTHDDTRDGHIPQSKFHTSMSVGGDGRLYSSTHTTAPGYGRAPFITIAQDYDDIRYRYPGSHFIVYDPNTGEAEDWGIPIPGDSAYGACLDWPNRTYYMMSLLRGHLHALDLNTGLAEDLGRIHKGGLCTLFIDRVGRLWTADTDGFFQYYEPATGAMVKLGIDMPRPEGREGFPNSLMPPIYWKEGKWVGTMLFEGRIWVLDTEAEGGPTVEDYGMGWGDFIPDSGPDKFVQVQPWELQFGRDGKLYYGLSPFNEDDRQTYFHAGLRMVQFDMETRERRGLGMLWAEGRPGFLFESRFQLPDGRLGWVDAGYWEQSARVIVFDPNKLAEIDSPCATRESSLDRQSDMLKAWQDDRKAYAEADLVSESADLLRVFGDGFPWKSCATTALAEVDGTLWGGTSGERAGLYTWDPAGGTGRVAQAAEISGADRIVALFPHNDCVLAVAAGASGFVFDARADGTVTRRADLPEGDRPVAALLVDDNVIMLTRAGSLFSCSVASGALSKRAQVKPNDLSSVLAVAGGRVFGCLQNGQVFTFDAATGEVVTTESFIPAGRGRQYEAQWESAVVVDGYIYGGTSDGYFFRMDPQSCEINNLGKPLLSLGLRALTALPDGTVYGAGGRREGLAHIFRYSRRGGLQDLGMIHDLKWWSTFSVGCMAVSADGAVYIGEEDDVAHLWRLRF